MLISFIRKNLTGVIYAFIVIFGLSVFLFSIAPLLSSFGIGQQAKSPVRTVAVARGHNFSWQDMETYANIEENQANQRGIPPSPITHIALQSRAIDVLAERSLLLDVYNDKDLSFDQAEKEKIIDQLCTSVLSQKNKGQNFNSGVLGDLSKRKACKDAFSQIVQNGTTFDGWVDDVEDQLKIQAVVKYINETEAGAEEKKVKERLERVLRKIKGKGEQAFIEEAAKVSEDTSNKSKGGDLGEFGRGVMVKPFEDAAFTAKIGEITGPVKTQFGFHLIYVYARKEAKGPEFDAAASALRAELLKKKQDAQATLSGSAKTKAPTVSDQEVKEAFQKVSARHILFKVKPQDDLFTAWLSREKSKIQVSIKDPLIDAFRYENRLPPHTTGQADPDETIRMYKAAVEDQDWDSVRHFMLSKAYLSKYEADVNKAEKEAADKTAELEKAAKEKMGAASGSADISVSVTPVKPKEVSKENLEEALKVINEAIRLTETDPPVANGTPAYPPQPRVGRFYLHRAQINEKLKKKEKGLLADTTLAAEHAAGDLQTLYGAKSLLEKLGETKKAEEVGETVTKLMEAFQKAQEAMQPPTTAPEEKKEEGGTEGRGTY